MLKQAFIQAVLLMLVFEQRLSFRKLKNADGGLKVLQAPQRAHDKAPGGGSRGKAPENFGILQLEDK